MVVWATTGEITVSTRESGGEAGSLASSTMDSWAVLVTAAEVVIGISSFRGGSAAMGSVCVMHEVVCALAALAYFFPGSEWRSWPSPCGEPHDTRDRTWL